MNLEFPAYWKTTSPEEVGSRTWLAYAFDVNPEWKADSADHWLCEWWAEARKALAAFANDDRLHARLTGCFELKADHDRIGRKYYYQRQRAEEKDELRDAGAGIVAVMEFGRSVTAARRTEKRRKIDRDSEGTPLPDLVLTSPPSSPPPARVRETTRIAGLRKVQGRVVRALESSIDDLIETHFPAVRATDPGKRVAELRKLWATEFSLFTWSNWEFHGALDMHVETGNVIRHCRPPWATDHVAVTEVAKALMAAKVFRSTRASATLQGQLFFVVASLRSSMPVAVPTGVTPVKCKKRHVKTLADLPPAPADAVHGIIDPVLYETAALLREFLSWIGIPVRLSDDFSMMLEKMEKAHLSESRKYTGRPMHRLPVQQLFLVEEGRTVVGTARSARMAVNAAQRWSASVRIEDALLPLAAALSTSRLLWEGTTYERKRKDVSFITRAIDDIVATYLAKVSVVNFRGESDSLAGGDAEADLEGEATEVDAGATSEEGDENETAIESAKKKREGAKVAADDAGEDGDEDPAIEHSMGAGEGTEAVAGEAREKGDEDAAVEHAKGVGPELELAEEPGKHDADEKADDGGISVPPADGSTGGKPKFADAVRQLMALKSAGSITAVDLGRLVKICADNELYSEGLCALASDAGAQIAYVQCLLPGPK